MNVKDATKLASIKLQLQRRKYNRKKALLLKFLMNQQNIVVAILQLTHAPTIKKIWVQPELWPPVVPGYFENVIPIYNDERFQRKFRLSRSTYNWLCLTLNDTLVKKDTKMRECIPVNKRVLIALTVLKSNCDLGTVADLFKVGKSTVGHILQQFCNAIITKLYMIVIKFPSNEQQRCDIAQGFWKTWRFPDTFGSLDGTHIPIRKPTFNGDDYYNYKSFHSVVVLAMVDFKYRFT